MSFVIDTNVLIVASNPMRDCSEKCFEFLEEIFCNKSVIFIDEFFDKKRQSFCSEIEDEYKKNISSQDYAYWLLRKIFDRDPRSMICRIDITKDEDENYSDFPSDLKNFDRNDKKFVAVAITSKQNPEIVNAVDADWKQHEAVLKKYVKLKFLCK
jgi:hypothetical protein